MARLYADEDFPLPVVEELRHLGHDVRTVQDADLKPICFRVRLSSIQPRGLSPTEGEEQSWDTKPLCT
jgi:hypothetical protein